MYQYADMLIQVLQRSVCNNTDFSEALLTDAVQ